MKYQNLLKKQMKIRKRCILISGNQIIGGQRHIGPIPQSPPSATAFRKHAHICCLSAPLRGAVPSFYYFRRD
jgi:hypothetical protein